MSKLLKEYVRMRIKGVILFVIFSAIFSVVFYLYQLPLTAVGYGVIICLLVGLIFILWDFRDFIKRHNELERAQKEVSLYLDSLPRGRNLIEEDYRKLVNNLFEDKRASEEEKEERYREMIDYYTLWAHQIKTPIAAMRLILQGEEKEESRELLSELFKIEQYVEMVLCYLRLDSDNSDFVIKEQALDPIIRQAIRRYAPQFIRKKLTVEYEGTDARVITDEKWLLFVLEQVLSNAIKYTNKGRIRVYMMDKILVVEDTGIGIKEEDIPRIFEKGFTGYNGRSYKKATGIGLYLSKRICKKLSHKISVESKLSMGTRIFIDLSSMSLEVE
ncbi:sensor histidine kinase [Alloiococcus sp. CFN-8]|uniref:sensor histidine kinase n=1 Tax=Alloiococcus sp. CFN-8 TaxID=3416081 RepID=UPI003CF9174E